MDSAAGYLKGGLPARQAPLARISHQASTAAADMGMSTALRSVGLLDVVSTTPPGPSVARLVSTPVSTASRRTLVRNAGQGKVYPTPSWQVKDAGRQGHGATLDTPALPVVSLMEPPGVHFAESLRGDAQCAPNPEGNPSNLTRVIPAQGAWSSSNRAVSPWRGFSYF